MLMDLSELAQVTRGRLVGESVTVRGLAIDSRALRGGDLFVALRGERFDGHDFVADCLQRGAAAAMVARAVDGGGPLLLVEDTRLALGEIATHWRSRFSIPLAAVTGSNGKTTVKEMLASILAAAAGSQDAVLATLGNLNNDIGVPLTLLRLTTDHRFAVIEMGMNHAGEISYLTRLAKPDVALVNNAMAAHLEGLGTVEAVAHAKGEIFEGLGASGTALINADDDYAPLWKSLAAGKHILTFGLNATADVSADHVFAADGTQLVLRTPMGSMACVLNVPGIHNVRNALAATAAALAMGAKLEHVATGLAAFGGVKGRLQRKAGKQQATILDDTYNANPASMKAAIDVLAAMPGKRILVLGDMGELGADAASAHQEIGAMAKAAGIDALYTLGELSHFMVAMFGSHGRHCADPEALAALLLPELDAQTTVLVKGSRFMKMERVVELLVNGNGKEAQHVA